MKKWVAVIATLFVGLAAWLIFFKSKPEPAGASPETIAREDAAIAAALSRQSSNTVAIIASNFARVQPAADAPDTDTATGPRSPAPSGPPTPMQFTNIPPEIVVENVRRAVRQFGKMFGGNPVGTNPEITSQLRGDNPRHINFINPEAGMRLNANGEMIDPWNTPYFFHQISGTEMEIRSAGPDKILWTSDDLVSR